MTRLRFFAIVLTFFLTVPNVSAVENALPDPWNHPGEDVTTGRWTVKDGNLEWHLIGPLGKIPELGVDVPWNWQRENRNGHELLLLAVGHLGQRAVGYNYAFRTLWQTQDSLVHFLGRVTGKGQFVWNAGTSMVLQTSDDSTRTATIIWGMYKCMPYFLTDCSVFRLDEVDQPLKELTDAEGRDSGFFVTISFPRFPVPAGGWNVKAVRGMKVVRQNQGGH